MMSWFDHWLRDAPAPARAKVELAVQGTTDRFIGADAMTDLVAPPVMLQLTADGRLEAPGSAPAQEVVLASDPDAPVPTLGGRNLLAAAGSTDHSDLIGRADTALFRLAPAEAEMLIAGPVSVRLTVRTETPSFDIGARLLDMAPDGSASLVLSHLARVAEASAGETEVVIDLGQIVHRIAPGHEIALLLAGSDFPAWDRNPQTGGNLFTSAKTRDAVLRILTGGERASVLSISWAEPE